MAEKKKLLRVCGKELVFFPAGYKDGVFDCEMVCPYSKYCEHLPDPREPENPEKRFIDFCGSIGLSDNTSGNLIPCNGTIEDNYKGDQDILQLLIKKNPMIGVKEFIDQVCSGFCDSYKSDYSGCSSENAACLLRNYFKNTKRKITEDPTMSIEEFNLTDAGLLKDNNNNNN